MKQNEEMKAEKGFFTDFLQFIKARRWLQILMIVVLVLCIIGAGTGIAWHKVMNNKILVDTETTEDDDGVLDDEIATTEEEKEQFMNILLCGVDYKKNTGRGKLTDVMMVIHLDFASQKVDILQMPRDTYIGREYSTGKLNAVYGSPKNGGIENLARQLNRMLKLPLDYYVLMDMDGFEDIVDAIGGVTVDSPYSFKLEGVTIVEGIQTLNGRQANKFVRERHAYAAGDLTRMKMQQIFMKAFMEKCLKLGKTEILKLAPSIFEYLTTDMTLNQALGLYSQFSDITLESVQFHSCEVTGFIDPYDRLAKLSVHARPLADLLNENFRENGEKVSWTDLGMLEYITDYPYEGEQEQYEKEDSVDSSSQSSVPSSSSSVPAVSRPSSSSSSSAVLSDSSVSETESSSVSSETSSESSTSAPSEPESSSEETSSAPESSSTSSADSSESSGVSSVPESSSAPDSSALSSESEAELPSSEISSLPEENTSAEETSSQAA